MTPDALARFECALSRLSRRHLDTGSLLRNLQDALVASAQAAKAPDGGDAYALGYLTSAVEGACALLERARMNALADATERVNLGMSARAAVEDVAMAYGLDEYAVESLVEEIEEATR